MTDHRVIDLSIEVPGTPEEVWDAIATGPGISSWFVPTAVEERAGGGTETDFGALGKEPGSVAAWDPPLRVVFHSREVEGRRLAYEWTVESLTGDTCRVRLVNSGFGPEEWGGDYDGMSEGWALFLESLHMHLTHFRGRHAATVVPVAMLAGSNESAWAALAGALGVPEHVEVGDSIKTAAAGVEPLIATVETVRRRPAATAVLFRVEEPVPGTGLLAAEGGGEQVAVSMYLYLYGDRSRAEQYGRAWDAWFAETFRRPSV